MGLKDILKRKLQNSEEFKELQRQDRLREILEERKKSANERELERFIKEKREDEIKNELAHFRTEQKKNMLKTNILSKENMFKGGSSIMKQDRSILTNNNKLLSMKRGCGKKSKGGMFFK